MKDSVSVFAAFACTLLTSAGGGTAHADEAASGKAAVDISVTSTTNGSGEPLLGGVSVELKCADHPGRVLSGKADATGHVTIEAPYGSCHLAATIEDKQLWWERDVHVSPGKNTVVLSDADILTLPVIVKRVEPIVPEGARSKRIEGNVILHAVIDKRGKVNEVNVLSSTNPIFNDAAVEAVRRWKYKPAVQNGNPVAVYYTIRVDFRLRGSPR